MQKSAVALGTFDGIHKAHREVLDKVLRLDGSYKKIAVTFKYPPKMNNAKIELLSTFEERRETLLSLGFDEVVVLDFLKVRDLSPEEFLNKLKNEYGAVFFSVGYNYRFGKNASGDGDFLRTWAEKNRAAVCITNKVLEGEHHISSTRIRECLKQGKLDEAEKMLGRCFEFTSPVISGDKRGRTIGLPTANQQLPDELTALRFGVYLSYALIEGKKYKSITNIGTRPTYKLEKPLSETYILDFSGDLYNKNITIGLVKFIRDEQKFESLDELKNAIIADLEQA